MADDEKKERGGKVSRFGKERFPDGDVEYRPLVRQGGRKPGRIDASRLRVPVKSSVSDPFEEKLKNTVCKIRKAEIVTDKAADTAPQDGKIGISDIPEELLWDDIENSISLSSSDRKPAGKDDEAPRPADNSPAGQDGDMERAYTVPDDAADTPFNRRKKAIACGVPPRFFYSMSKGGFLEGDITEESVQAALEAFYRKRVLERIDASNLTPEEMDAVMEEIENIKNGRSKLFDREDFTTDMSPDELFKTVIDRIKYGTRPPRP